MSNPVMARCCACGDESKALATKGDALELVRGLAYVGHGKWLCAGCTRTATAEFARAAQVLVAAAAKKDAPPEGFA